MKVDKKYLETFSNKKKNKVEKFSNKKKNKIEKFSNRSNRQDFIDKAISFLPFFLKWPMQFYYSIFKKGWDNPIYWGVLFIWFVFMKKTVRTNLEDTYRYRYGA